MIHCLVGAFIWCVALRATNAQIVPNTGTSALKGDNDLDNSNIVDRSRTPLNLTVTGIVDGGGNDRYGTIVLRQGDWLLEDINWVNRSGTDAVSLFLAGRRLHVGHRLDVALLAGPWYEYANRAWDNAVIDTNVQFQSERFRFVSINHWGIPVRATGELFDSHTATVTRVRGLPRWLGLSGQIERSREGIVMLWVGPAFTAKRSDVSLSGVPYWDFRHHAAGLRVTISYHMELDTKRQRTQNNSQK